MKRKARKVTEKVIMRWKWSFWVERKWEQFFLVW